MKKLMLLALLVTAGFIRMFAQQPGIVISDKPGWHNIGETVVDFQREKDEISVLGADRFTFVKIKVKDAPIDLISLKWYTLFQKILNK